MKRVIIIAAGAQANVPSGVLAQAEDVGEIVLTDINPDRTRKIAEINRSDKIETEILDASDMKEMAAHLSGTLSSRLCWSVM